MPPGVKFATLAACPVFGGTVGQVDDAKAKALPGVRQVIVLKDAVAVVGDHMWAAKQGLAALDITWNEGPNSTVSSDEVWRRLRAASGSEGAVAKSVGDVAKGLAEGDRLEAAYELPFLAHATMEPMNCTVHVTPTSCEVWIGSQVLSRVQATAAKVTGLPLDKVTAHNHLLGGGFGRRLEVDMVDSAVQIAKQVDGPVKVVWTREEDIQHDLYRPVYRDVLSATISNGRIVGWKHRIAGSAIIARWLPPAFKKGSTSMPSTAPSTFPTTSRICAWNTCAKSRRPCRRDSGAASAPTTMCSPSKASWMSWQRKPTRIRSPFAAICSTNRRASRRRSSLRRPRPGGEVLCRHARVAVSQLQVAFGSFIATVAEAEVDTDGEVRVHRIVSAVDTGIVVNPDTVVAQLQGGLIFGLTAALYGNITIDKGRVQQSNFNDYRMLRINETPHIEVHLIKSGEAPGGIGETGATAAPPAVGNALFAATGIRLRRLPIDRDVLAGKKPS